MIYKQTDQYSTWDINDSIYVCWMSGSLSKESMCWPLLQGSCRTNTLETFRIVHRRVSGSAYSHGYPVDETKNEFCICTHYRPLSDQRAAMKRCHMHSFEWTWRRELMKETKKGAQVKMGVLGPFSLSTYLYQMNKKRTRPAVVDN